MKNNENMETVQVSTTFSNFYEFMNLGWIYFRVVLCENPEDRGILSKKTQLFTKRFTLRIHFIFLFWYRSTIYRCTF